MVNWWLVFLFLTTVSLISGKVLQPQNERRTFEAVNLNFSDPQTLKNLKAENWCISNYGIQICASARMAGAVDFLTWNGKQFINAYDHGRELQIAISNQSGECYNPTEAGSSTDATGERTSSILQGVNTNGNVLRTTSLPAFWVPPGHYDAGCGYAVNRQIVSAYQTSKAVTIGLLGYTNAIFYQFDVKIPEHQAYLQIESPTGYLAMEFNTFWTINLATGAVTPQNAGPAETPDPVIISTSDQKYAMGAYLVSAPVQYASYARFYFPNSYYPAGTSKWSNVWRTTQGVNPGQDIGFASVICIGSVQQVQGCMYALAQKTGYVH